MYLRSKIQSRALSNLNKCKNHLFPGKRVTKGYVLSLLLDDYKNYVKDDMLSAALKESDVKEDGSGIAVNFNITAEANNKLYLLKVELDQYSGRSLFPAQIIDILLICAVNSYKTSEFNIELLTDVELIKKIAEMSLSGLASDKEMINKIKKMVVI